MGIWLTFRISRENISKPLPRGSQGDRGHRGKMNKEFHTEN